MKIRLRYTLIMSAVLVLMIAVLWAANHYYLERYYQRQKLEQIEEVREKLLDYVEEEADRGTAEAKIRQACQATDIDAMLIRDNGGFPAVIFATFDGDSAAASRLLSSMLGRGERTSDMTVYKDEEDYFIYKVRDKITSTDQIDCFGTVSVKEGPRTAPYYYMLTVPVASIAESAALANRFLLLVGLGTVLLGALIMYLVSWRMTKPIEALTGISRKMAVMDFSDRYQGTSADEIGVLGSNMNEMARALEENIAELKAANLRLEADVEEMAKQDRMRRELLANISHELKTPIALVSGYAEGLKEGIIDDPSAREEYCNVILDESARMGRLVKQLLSLNELESGAVKPEKETFDLAEMIRSLAAKFKLPAEEMKVEIIDRMPETRPVFSDEFMTEQVVQNYLSNAFNHVSEGGRVELSCGETGGHVWFSVFNTGEPIPAASLTEIWDKFYKVDKARTRAYGGSGIGLSIVKASMDRLGGSCSAENKAGGVEFRAEF